MMEEAKDLNRYAKYVFLGSLALLMAAALFYTFGVRAVSQERNNWSQSLAMAEMQVQQLNLRLIDETEKMRQADLGQFRQRVPDRPEIKQMIVQLEAWEKSSGLSLENLTISLYPDGRQAFSQEQTPMPQPSAAQAEEQASPSSAFEQAADDIPWSVVEMTIAFTGTTGALDRFMAQVEKSPRLVRLIHMDYSQGTGEPSLRGNMVLHAYYSEAFRTLDNNSKQHVYSK